MLLLITITTCDKLINSKLCDVCKCVNTEDDLVIVNCAKIYLKGSIENWTSLIKNVTFTRCK